MRCSRKTDETNQRDGGPIAEPASRMYRARAVLPTTANAKEKQGMP
jgi:hypothetical protein